MKNGKYIFIVIIGLITLNLNAKEFSFGKFEEILNSGVIKNCEVTKVHGEDKVIIHGEFSTNEELKKYKITLTNKQFDNLPLHKLGKVRVKHSEVVGGTGRILLILVCIISSFLALKWSRKYKMDTKI